MFYALTSFFVLKSFAIFNGDIPEVNELILKQKQMSEEKRLKLDHPVSTTYAFHIATFKSLHSQMLCLFGAIAAFKNLLCYPEWISVADIPGCLESWPGEPGPGKCQSDVRTPDPKEEAAWGGKEGVLG